ncbi:MAG: hypothetical protein LBU28_08025 [Spirochaetaceae bacterium]|nr:hypothetical protein [Spirochaetaceae bacterium]
MGALINRRSWHRFRQRFNDLRLKPFLDYAAYQTLGEEGGLFRFIGGFESTDGHTLWIRSDKLTVPVAIARAQTYILPILKGSDPSEFLGDDEVLEQIRWNRVSALTEGSRVFIGGRLRPLKNRMTFVSSREDPLMVIFYDCPERFLPGYVVRSAQYQNEYWNHLTPYGLILGAFSLLILALSFLPRPAYRLTIIPILIALFTPVYPMLPPGMLFTMLARRLWRQVRIFLSYRNLLRLPLVYFSPGEETARLPNGEAYGFIRRDALSGAPASFPPLIPVSLSREAARKGESWHLFGSLDPSPEGPAVPRQPRDPFAPQGAIPGNPNALARKFTIQAYLLEISAWLVFLTGLGLNILFIGTIIYLFR